MTTARVVGAVSREAAEWHAIDLRAINRNVRRLQVAAFVDFGAKRGVAPLRYSFEDLEEERQSADRLKA